MSTHKRLGFFAVQLFSLFLLAACGGGGGSATPTTPTTPTASVSGAAQKGNFIQAGTTVTAYKLNDDGTRSTTTATGSMTADGAFSVPGIDWTGWTEIEVTGKYTDETTGNESTDPITLTSLVEVTSTTGFTTNVNVLTHMQAKRTQKIIADTPGTSITAADTQALGEVQSELLGGSTSDPAELNITQNGTDNAKLLLLSGAFLAASDAATGTSRQADLDVLATDFSDNGTTNSTLADAIGNRIDENGFLATLETNLGISNTANLAPNINDATFSVDENSAKDTVVGTQTGTDPDGNTLTYSIISGNNNNAFAIDSATGEITVNDSAQFNAETVSSYSLTVQVSDGQSPVLIDTATITVNVNNINEAPSISDATFSVAENSAKDTVVGTQTGTDPDSNTLSYSITAGNDNGAFAIDSASGQITVNDGTKLDADVPATASYALTVQVSDGQTPALTDTATITVTVTDVNEAPSIEDKTLTVPENSPNDTVVGKQEGTDPEDDTLTYSITAGNDDNVFAIDEDTGAITVNDGTKLDTETPANASYSLTVQVSDGQMPALTDDATITINVSNVNERAVIAFVRPDSVPKRFVRDNEVADTATDTHVVEWAANGTVVGEIIVTSEGDSPVSGRVVREGDENGVISDAFEINENDQIVVMDSTMFDTSSYDLTAVYTSVSGDSDPVSFKVTVHPDFSHLKPKVMPLGDSITHYRPSYTSTLKINSTTELKMNIDFIGTSLDEDSTIEDIDDKSNEGWNGFSAITLLNKQGFGEGPKSDIGATPHYCDVNEGDRQYFPFVFSHSDPDTQANINRIVAMCSVIFPGKNTGAARSIIDFSLAQQVPDLVLIHLGTNDFYRKHIIDTDGAQASDTDAAIDDLEELVGRLRASNPNVRISIAQIIPLSSDPLLNHGHDPDYIPLYNAALVGLVDKLNLDGRGLVTLVDQYTDFVIATDLNGDGVHPSPEGSEKIGDKWFEHLKPIFGISE